MASRSTSLKIEKPTQEEVGAYLTTHSCGLRLARAACRRQKLREAAKKASTVEELRLVVRELIDNAMLRI